MHQKLTVFVMQVYVVYDSQSYRVQLRQEGHPSCMDNSTKVF